MTREELESALAELIGSERHTQTSDVEIVTAVLSVIENAAGIPITGHSSKKEAMTREELEKRLAYYISGTHNAYCSYPVTTSGIINLIKTEIPELFGLLDGSMEDKGKLARHLKSGGLYQVIGEGKIEADLSPVVIYQNIHNRMIWVRPRDEFYDGRFEILDAVAQCAEGDNIDGLR